MDKHEKGIEIDPTRVDVPLPQWNGRYRGDPKRLPKVVQKLVHRRPLTPEEKAELLWRFYELDQGGRFGRKLFWIGLIVICIVGIVGFFAYAHWDWVLGRLAPPR